MTSHVTEIVCRLADNAEMVCRHYLSNGRREGRYWIVGDVANTPGRSLYVRLFGPLSGEGACGKWTDSATGQHGDLLDLIALSCGIDDFGEILAEARRFLGLAPSAPAPRPARLAPSPKGLPETAHRLLMQSCPLARTLAEDYLRARSIAITPDLRALRFHPRCFYRTTDPATGNDRYEAWPALLAKVADIAGRVTGLHRTWLDPSGREKAPVPSPRRSLGEIAGHGVWFGAGDDVMVAGEGLETVLSVRTVLPQMPMAAALSSSHLAAFRPPYTLRRLYIAQDNDHAGHTAAQKLSRSALCVGIEPIVLTPALKDFNDDLRQFGVDGLRATLLEQLRLDDVTRFMTPAAGRAGGNAGAGADRGDSPAAREPRPRACEGAI